jgi:hypothetical protein
MPGIQKALNGWGRRTVKGDLGRGTYDDPSRRGVKSAKVNGGSADQINVKPIAIYLHKAEFSKVNCETSALPADIRREIQSPTAKSLRPRLGQASTLLYRKTKCCRLETTTTKKRVPTLPICGSRSIKKTNSGAASKTRTLPTVPKQNTEFGLHTRVNYGVAFVTL